MSIVLNEHEWAENMINTRSLGEKPYETLCRVARYYIDKNYSKRDVRLMLDSFVIQCNPSSSVVLWADTLDYAVQKALKTPAMVVDGIIITEPEMDKISELESTQLRRLAFTLLCLAKYSNIKRPSCDCWVTNDRSDIMKMANISTSIKRRCELFKALSDKGLIRFSKKVDNTNVRINFIEEGDPALRITDFRNLGYQYLKYRGEAFYECQCCGIISKTKNPNIGRPPKYCGRCAGEIQAKQIRNAVYKYRNLQQ